MNNQGNSQPLDSFELHAQSILSQEVFGQLIKLRNQHMSELNHVYKQNPSLTGKEVNAMHNLFFKEISQLVGSERYEALFGISADQEVHLIDEKIFDSQQSLRKK